MIKKTIAFAILILLLNIGQAFSWSTEDGLESYHSLSFLKNQVNFWMLQDNRMEIDNNAYYLKTHPILTNKVIELFQERYNIQLTASQKLEIVWGSIEEDWDVEGSSTDSCYANVGMDEDYGIWKTKIDEAIQHNRAVNHFIGPNNSPLSDISDDIQTSFCDSSRNYSSLQWAKNASENAFRYDRLVAQYTSEPALGWRAIGHIIHLLEDCTSPAHVRNDAHIFNEDNYEILLKGKTPAEHDEWMQPQGEGATPIKDFNDIDPFFIELSEMTRSNYFSNDTVFSSENGLSVELADHPKQDRYFYNKRNITGVSEIICNEERKPAPGAVSGLNLL